MFMCVCVCVCVCVCLREWHVLAQRVFLMERSALYESHPLLVLLLLLLLLLLKI